VADALDMNQFRDESYDIVIEKSTLDAILCGDKSFLNAAKMLKEVQRVLKTGGLYIIISYGSPDNRLFHLVNSRVFRLTWSEKRAPEL
jgi:EEF1A lysine methyltransferase 4